MNAHDQGQTIATEIRYAAIFALLFVGAFPPIGIWWLGYWAPVPITLAAWRTTKPWRTLLVFTSASALACAFLHRWLIEVTIPGYPIMCVLFGLFYGLYVLLIYRARRRNVPIWFAMPMCWVGLEFFRGQIAFDGYPWYLLGQATMRTIEWERPSSIAYLASFVGSYGLSLIVCTISLPLILDQAKQKPSRRPTRARMLSGLVLLAWGTIGAWLARPSNATDPPTLRVGIVQTNLPQDNKLGWSFDDRPQDFIRFLDLTATIKDFEMQPDVIVWPETMYPGLALDSASVQILDDTDDAYPVFDEFGPVMRTILTEVQTEMGIPMLVGTETFDNLTVDLSAFDDESIDLFSWDARYNSVVMLDEGRVIDERYSKLHLTPFGEVMPYISNWPWLEQSLLDFGAGGMSFDLDAGDQPHAFALRGGALPVRVAPLICFEATNPAIAGHQVYHDGARRADVLAHITNDGWFGSYPGGRHMHALIARLRAIEAGTPVVRVANTGISCAFDNVGKRLELQTLRLDQREPTRDPYLGSHIEGVAIVELPLPQSITLASRTGDFGWLALAGLIVCVAMRRPSPMQSRTETTHEEQS
ncbi:MAG: apolipoprotein N-acyltransferase [Planctomycetota bacterium]